MSISAEDDAPFSEALLGAYRKVMDADPKSRGVAMDDFAQAFIDEYDPTDPFANESFHEFFEEYEVCLARADQANLEVGHATMRIARLGVEFMSHVLADDEAHHVLKVQTPKKPNKMVS